jgi:hypothetical protein
MGRLAHLLTDTVTIASETGRSNTGDPTFGAQSTIAARVEEIDQIVLLFDGNEARATHSVASEDEIKRTDRLWLPGDNTSDNTKARRALTVKHSRFPGETDGLYEAYL